jgi:acetyl esterase/lipase
MYDGAMLPRRWPTAMRVLLLLLALGLGLLWLRRSRVVATPPFVPITPVVSARVATTLHGLLEKKTPSGQVGVRVDLYLPASAARPPPLMVFMEGGRWSTPDDKTMLGAAVADAMQRRGIAVAWLRFELAGAYTLRACASDVAAVVRELAARAGDHRYDGSRVTLVGNGLGASMAATIALEPGPSVVSRVVAVRGTYDYAEAALEGNPDASLVRAAAVDADERVAASPLAKVRAGAPPFLLLGASDDGADWAARAHAFMRSLERAGSRDVQFYMADGRDPRSVLDWAGEGNELGELVASFVTSGPTPQPIDGPFGAKQRWTTAPPLDHQAFWADESLVVRRPVDGPFNEAMARVFQGVMYELNVLAGKQYAAIPLEGYLRARAEHDDLGRGEHLIITNIRGEQQYLTRADLKRHAPVIVIGIDDEKNLYRLFTWYRLKREYSWKPGDAETPPTMIRPTGAFLLFPAGTPAHLRDATLAPFGLTPEGFRFVEKDPLARARGLGVAVQGALVGSEGCLRCHSLGGEGARAHHVRALDGKAHGGFALPLEEYPPDVLHRFLFEQEAVAESFGVGPLKVGETAARALEQAVARAR